MSAAEERIAACLAAALEQRDAGREPDLEALCDGDADAIAAVREALQLQPDVAALHARRYGDALLGAVLRARFRVDAVLGAGAMGTVCRARDLELGRDVAVKVLAARPTESAAARMRREAELLAGAEHRALLRIYERGALDDGGVFLVTELLEGCSLAAVLAASAAAMPNGPDARAFARVDWLRALLPAADLERTYLLQVVQWATELGEGLAAAHARGVVHRDVKPSNAFVRSDGTAVLLDFGIAARAGDPALTAAHEVLGTPHYMAPEQLAGGAEPGPALDVYGLGATIYHLLTLRPPHPGDLADVLEHVRRDDPEPASWLHRGLPRDLQAILDRALERRPRDRYPDAAAMVADLRAFADHRPVSARPIGGLARTWRRVRRQPARALAAFASIGIVLLLAVVLPMWSALASTRDRAEHDDLQARLPALLSIEGWPDQRMLVPLDERAGYLRDLDRMLQLEKGDHAARLLRAALRLDAGDRDGARADLDALAARAGGAYLREVARRYAAADSSSAGIAAVQLGDLPAPVTPIDHFVAGFHALRARDCDRAVQELDAAGDLTAAQDLRLLALLGQEPCDARRVLAEASRLEGVYGRATARTRHAMGAAMLHLRQWDDAIPLCEESLRLRPDRHGPWNNLGLAYLRLGKNEQALRCYRHAVDLRPWFDNSLSGLAQTLRNLERFDEARTAAERIGDAGWREYELANVEIVRAIRALRQRDDDGRRAAAAAAIAHFERSAAVEGSTNPKRRAIPAAIAHAETLRRDDLDGALDAFLELLRREPRNPQQLYNLVDMLEGRELRGETLTRLRLWIAQLAVDLEPDTPEYREARDALWRALHPR
ncbi:MAG: protein kinase [Planctomycetota bacterium]